MVSLRFRRLLPLVASLGLVSFLLVAYRQAEYPLYPTKWADPFVGAPGTTASVPDTHWTTEPNEVDPNDSHPILDLIAKADTNLRALLAKETDDLPGAAQRYRELRGRHPPPGFDKWWKYAKENDVLMVEEFWDQIYHDLTPLWALDQKEMRSDVSAQERLFKVRGGKVTHESAHFWMDIWKELIGSVADYIPDMDIAMNSMDESRLLVPWETMDGYVTKELTMRTLLPAEKVVNEFSKFTEVNTTENLPEFPWNRSYQGIWERHSDACNPSSDARRANISGDVSLPPVLNSDYTKPHTYKGYVSNYTLSCSICHQPDLAKLHGFFIEPISISTSTKLLPLFGSSKLTVNSEILLPATMYYKGDPRFKSDHAPIPWEEKTDTLFWRGLASGGRNKVENWKGFHRHRLISMLNGTQALAMPHNSSFIDIADLPLKPWNLESWANTSVPHNVAMGEWLANFTDAGFNDLACFPTEDPPRLGCTYTDYIFTPLPSKLLHEIHQNKYLVDVDGNSFSGRYLDFLQSGSMPIKTTLFREWHDSRLVAWKHFVPFDNRFLDLYGIMEFFLGYGENKGRDRRARRIAEEGREWAGRVLREVDMRAYVFRLLLEYARVMDEKREVLGWVDDLTMNGSGVDA